MTLGVVLSVGSLVLAIVSFTMALTKTIMDLSDERRER